MSATDLSFVRRHPICAHAAATDFEASQATESDGFCVSTLYRWKAENPEFCQALRDKSAEVLRGTSPLGANQHKGAYPGESGIRERVYGPVRARGRRYIRNNPMETSLCVWHGIPN
jgi:hypothetical protein